MTSVLALLALLAGCRHDARPEAEWQIVFQSDRGGEIAWWAIRLDGTGLVRIASGPTVPGGAPPAVSPDGRQLLLPGADGLVVHDAEGARRLASGWADSAAWSPDGDRIAFNGLSPGISVIDADGTDGRNVTRNRGDYNPVWSPDARMLAFTRNGVGVMVIGLDGTGRRAVWRTDASHLIWSPDGKRLSFLPWTDDGQEARRVTVDVSTGRVISSVATGVADAYDYRPSAVAPDGRRVAVTVATRAYVRSAIEVMDIDGTNRVRVTPTREHSTDPIWAPDGRSIVYTRDAVDGRQLWSVRPDGSARRPITRGYPNGGTVSRPAWARIPFAHRPSPFGIHARRTATGGELDVPFPVAEISAAGATAAIASAIRVYAPAWLVTPPLIVWDTARGGTAQVTLIRCDVPSSIVLSGGRIAHDCRSIPHAVAYVRGSVYVVDRDRRGAVSLNGGVLDAERGTPGELPGRVAGADGTIVFAVDAFNAEAEYVRSTLWRVRGRRSERIRASAGEPVAVEGGRIVTEERDGRVALLDLDGRVLRFVAPGGRGGTPTAFGERFEPTAGLSRRDLVVLRVGRLRSFDAATGALRSERTVPRDAVFAGVARGLAAFVSDANVHVVALRDARETIFRTGGRSVRATLTDAGLFYAFHRKPLIYRSIQRHERNPARVVFVRRDALERRLR